jgi:hypothetical protein
MGLREYMAAMDSAEPMTALESLDPDLRFLLALPSGDVIGTSRAEFESYIASRNNPIDRIHHILRHQVDGDTEFAFGIVTELGETIGTFLAAAVLTEDGRLSGYQSFFHTGFRLLDFADADKEA